MAFALIADGHASRLQFAQLVPGHIAATAAIDRVGGDENSEWQFRRAQAWPGFLIDRAISVVDGQGHGAVGQSGALFQAGDDA